MEDELDLSRGMKNKMREASTKRRKIMHGDGETLTHIHKRKSPSDKKLTPENIEAVRKWIFENCDKVSTSPNARDQVFVTDPITGEKKKHQKWYYKFSKRELYNDFKKPVQDGGFHLSRDKNGNMEFGRTSFEKCLPPNLGRMTNTQKCMLGCETVSYTHLTLPTKA